MVTSIISGFQTGADQGALYAARDLGLKTGGYVPKGWRTETGSKESEMKSFGLIEAASSNYLVRTKLNVNFSDGTLIIGNLEISVGSKHTIKFCKELNKPFFYVKWPTQYDYLDNVPNFLKWVSNNNIKVLNVAGNRESSVSGLTYATKYFLVEALKI